MADSAEGNIKTVVDNHFESMILHLYHYVKGQNYKLTDVMAFASAPN